MSALKGWIIIHTLGKVKFLTRDVLLCIKVTVRFSPLVSIFHFGSEASLPSCCIYMIWLSDTPKKADYQYWNVSLVHYFRSEDDFKLYFQKHCEVLVMVYMWLVPCAEPKPAIVQRNTNIWSNYSMYHLFEITDWCLEHRSLKNRKEFCRASVLT